MKRKWFLLLLSLALYMLNVYSQQEDVEKREFLKKAPARVQEYYRVFDSLANPTWTGKAHKKWSLNELKKYASIVNAANEYDPIQREINYKNNLIKSRSLKDKFGTDDIDAIEEVEERISKKHAALIKSPYWLTITVEDIVIAPYTVEDDPNAKINEIKIIGKVTKVWKGEKYKIGDIVSGYYYDFWNYHGLLKGSTCIIALYPIMKKNNPYDIKYALGGPDHVQSSIYPIENGYVIDEDNTFKMGKKIELRIFNESLSSTINQIRLWRNNNTSEKRP